MAKNKRKSKDLKSALIGCAFVMAISVTSVIGVKAFLTSGTEDKFNFFSPMTYTDIGISEANGTSFTIGNVNKSAVVTNSSEHNLKPVYIRVAVVPVVRGENDLNLSEKYNYTVGNFTPGSHWTKGSDGYYYYTIPVDPGESTTDLFNGIMNLPIMNGATAVDSLPDDVTQVEIQVIADAVQAVEVDVEPNPNNSETWPYSTAPAVSAWGDGISTLLSTSKS